MRKPLSMKQKLVLLASVLLIVAVLAVIRWAAIKAAEITGPGAMAVDAQGQLWLNIDRGLFIIDQNGNIVRELDLQKTGIALPVSGMAAFRDDELLVGSRTGGDIHRMNARGEILGRLGANGVNAWKPFGAFHLAYHPGSRQILVTDTSNHRVLLLNEQGNLLRESKTPAAAQPYRFPNNVIVNNAGNFTVVDTNNRRVLALNGSLESQTDWPTETFSERYQYPVFIAQAPAGDYYLTIHDSRLDYAEVVILNDRGERQGAVAFETDVIPNGLVTYPHGVLVADAAAYAIWRIHGDGNSVSRFGGPRLQDLLREGRDTKAFYESLVALCQKLLILLLVILLVIATVMQIREQKKSARVPLPMEHAAIPPLQIWATFKQQMLLIPILLLPMFLALSLLVQVYGVCTMSTIKWLKALMGNGVVLLPWIGLAWLCRHSYRNGILRGRYHRMFVRRAHILLNRHRTVPAAAISLGEQIVGVEIGLLARRPALVVITNKNLWVMALSLFGTHVRRIQAIALAAVAGPEVVQQTGLRSLVSYMGIPIWRLRFAAAGTRQRYAIEFPDGYGANRLAEHMQQHAFRSPAPTGPAVQDAPCPDCVAPGKSVAVATLLALIFPGLGQFYAEEMYKGIVFLLGGAFLGLTLLEPVVAYFYRTKDVSLYATTVAVIMLLTLWLIALVDAIMTTRRNQVNRVGLFVLE